MGGAFPTVQVCTGHHAPKRRDIHMKTFLKTLLWAELITLILGCCVWLYGRRFWNGGSALLGLICAFVQLPLELCPTSPMSDAAPGEIARENCLPP